MRHLLQFVGACIALQLVTASDPICVDICPKEYPITNNDHLPYPGDCTKFCHCANDGKWLKDCPIADTATGARLHFNPTLQVCDWDWRAGCNSTLCDEVCPKVWPIEENNHLPYPGDCTRFCHCANDGNWEKYCPIADEDTGVRLHFNAALQVCDFEENAKCV